MDTFILLLTVLVLLLLAAVILIYREVRRLRFAVARAGQGDPCRNQFEMRMRCVDSRLQELNRKS